jgi:nucleotide-binding universal stress UspA family protein
LHEVIDHPRLGSPVDLLTVVQGRPSQVIVDHALAHDSDLVILGGHRHRQGLHIGSTARAVLALSRAPVWVQAEPAEKIVRILAAIDMSPDSNLVLSVARDLGSRLGAKVCAFHSFVPPHFPYQNPAAAFDVETDYGFEDFKAAERKEFDRIIGDFDWQSVGFEALFSEGIPAERILAMQDSTDLIVMGTHGRTGLSRVLFGSQAYAVVKKAHRPVLAVPNPEREFAE